MHRLHGACVQVRGHTHATEDKKVGLSDECSSIITLHTTGPRAGDASKGPTIQFHVSVPITQTSGCAAGTKPWDKADYI